MSNTSLPAFPSDAMQNTAMDIDYAFLRREGILWLERLAGSEWTDFNAHDPGITILEQFCYALTDLDYRIDYNLKDLLAEGEADSYRSLHSPAEVLTTNPVTLTDLRKVVIDVDGVKNAWIEPLEDPQPTVYYDPAVGNLYLEAAPHREAVTMRGLYRVLIAADGSLPDADLAHLVNQCLHGCRNLGQEFFPAKILTEQRIAVEATVEIGAADDADRLLAEIHHALSRFISPRIRFQTLAEMLARGRSIDEIMDGPVLRHGFIDTAELEGFGRKKGLRVSDLIQEIMNVAGVSAINSISIRTDRGDPESWYLKLDQNSTPVLDVVNSSINLLRGKITARSNLDRVNQIFEDLQQADQFAPLPEAERDIRLPAGRDRQAWRYHSIQHQFPAAYGIGESGLPASATAQRQGQARQLKAYLLFFDQLLANCFAQLANAKSLFSFDSPQPQTYFSQLIDDRRLGLDGLWTDPQRRADNLRRITETLEVANERKNRFLNHLLARFAEDFAGFSHCGFEAASPEAQIKTKCAFLQDYRQLSANRGAAFDCSLPAENADNVSGLEKRISRKLGLSTCHRQKLADLPADGEGGFHMLEHILLRPRPADQAAAMQGAEAGGWQVGVLLALPTDDGIPPVKDPYSQQISFIFPDWIERFKQEVFRDCIGQLLRDEAPAHLHVRLLWLDQKKMRDLESAYQDWLGNIDTLAMDAGNTKVRDARDRLVDWLGMGTPYPLQDVELEYDPVVALDQPVKIRIRGAQGGVRYWLCDENGDPLADGQGKPFSVLCEAGRAAEEAILPMPAIVKDISFTILASRVFDVRGKELQTPLETYLKESVNIKAGINSALAVEFIPTADQIGKDAQITINYADTFTVAVKASQAGISYELVTDGNEISLSESKPGDRNEIHLVSQDTFKEDTTIKVKAYRTLGKTDFKYLDKKLTVLVRPNPKVAASAASPIIDYAAQTTLTLADTQSSASYQLFKRELTVADYPPAPTGDLKVLERTADRGNKAALVPIGEFNMEEGKCSVSTGSLLEDTLFIVQATKKENKEALWLEQAVVVLVRPNTSPAVGAKALKIPANAEGTVTVSDTQKGVMYQLRLDGGNQPVNPPGYHWEDRGVGTARLEVDFVVERPDQPEDYKTLLLPTGRLASDTTFNVLATKRLTGLEAPLDGKVKIGVGG